MSHVRHFVSDCLNQSTMDNYHIPSMPRVHPTQPLLHATLEPLFGLPFEQAAKRLGICTCDLEDSCRKLGMNRWPYPPAGAVAAAPLSPDILWREIRKLQGRMVDANILVQDMHFDYEEIKQQLAQQKKQIDAMTAKLDGCQTQIDVLCASSSSVLERTQ